MRVRDTMPSIRRYRVPEAFARPVRERINRSHDEKVPDWPESRGECDQFGSPSQLLRLSSLMS